MSKTDTIYLDHAAGTQLLPEVQTLMSQWMEEGVVNPSSIHRPGRESAALLDNARLQIARALGAKPSEIRFTSGGTEANNLALFGAAQALQKKGRHIITCVTEHPSVLQSCKALEANGFDVSYLSVDGHGELDPQEFERLITAETILASFMWVNNETGLVHPVEELARIAHEHDVRFHCDAVQAVGHIPIDLSRTHLDSLSISGHKLGAPGGIGALYVKKGHAISAQIHGGAQEQSERAGTQNHLGSCALGRAVEIHSQDPARAQMRQDQLLQRLVQGIQQLPGIQLNRGGKAYSPHILNCSFKGLDGEALFIRLDMSGIAISNGAACSSGSQAPSHVLTSMGFDRQLAQASLRISLGRNTNQTEIDAFCSELGQIVQALHKED